MTQSQHKQPPVDPLEADYAVLDTLGIDWSSIPHVVRGKQIEVVQLRDGPDGPFVAYAICGSPHANVNSVSVPKRWHAHPVVNYLGWLWFVDRLESVSASKVRQYSICLLDALSELDLEECLQDRDPEGVKFGQKIRSWARKAFLGAPNNDYGNHLQSALRSFLPVGLEIYWGIDEAVASSLASEGSNTRVTRGIHVLTLDDEYGPFTKAQRVAIENWLNVSKPRPLIEALVRLHRYVGLRPLQTVLLRESDLYQENGNWYLDVPLVKGQYSNGKRNKSAVRKYRIPTDVADALNRLIQTNADNPMIHPLTGKAIKEPALRPIFTQERTGKNRQQVDVRTAEYYYHMTAQRVSGVFRDLSWEITTTNVDPETKEKVNRAVRLSAYRFRYTVGTLLAQKGQTLREIAAWLGHKGEESVRFYIKMAQEWWDHDETLSLHSVQQKAIAALDGAFVDKLPRDPSTGEVAACIAMTGTCVLPPGVTECPYDPMKSCLTCEARHDRSDTSEVERQLIAQALKDNLEEIDFWQANSTAQEPLGMMAVTVRLSSAAAAFEILTTEWNIA